MSRDSSFIDVCLILFQLFFFLRMQSFYNDLATFREI